MHTTRLVCSLLLFFVFAFFNTKGQPLVKDQKVLKEILDYSQSNSVRKDSVNWDSIKVTAAKLHNQGGLIPASQYILKSLNDYHGRIWHNNIPYNGIHKKFVRSNMKVDSLSWVNYQQTTLPIKSTILQNQYGYLRVPGMIYQQQDSLNAHTLNNKINQLENEYAVQGWIIDLRMNGGGTMYPMLSGLSALLGNQIVGSFIEPNSNLKQNWKIEKGDVWVDTFQVTNYHLSSIKNLSLKPVVVLISSYTASSGEVVAIAFKNRPNTTFIGEPTSAYTTTVSWHVLKNNMVFQLTESWYADRKDNIYFGTPVVPDIKWNEGNNFENLENDLWILEAIKIFSNKSNVRN